MGEFFGGMSRGEAAIFAVAALIVVAWAVAGPGGVIEGIVPALAIGLLCGVVIAIRRGRSAR